LVQANIEFGITGHFAHIEGLLHVFFQQGILIGCIMKDRVDRRQPLVLEGEEHIRALCMPEDLLGQVHLLLLFLQNNRGKLPAADKLLHQDRLLIGAYQVPQALAQLLFIFGNCIPGNFYRPVNGVQLGD
jgi:hypothetical protein